MAIGAQLKVTTKDGATSTILSRQA